MTSALYGENLIGFQQRARVIHTRISSSRAGHRTKVKTPHHYRDSSRLITIALMDGAMSEGSGALKSLSRFPFSTVDTCQNLGASGLKNLSVYAKSSVAKAPGK